MSETGQRLSDQLVRLVQVVFALVIGQSLLLYRSVVLNPFANNSIASLALVTIYISAILSWIDWHTTMEANPYNLSASYRFRWTEELRVGMDLLVVTLYAYVLFSVSNFEGRPGASIQWYLLGFVLIFASYLGSGILRLVTHGRLASRPKPIIEFGGLYLLLFIIYLVLIDNWLKTSSLARTWLNGSALILSLVLMLLYRYYRRKLRASRQRAKQAGIRVGVDLDGVLANQIDGLLPRIKSKYGLEVHYNDVTQWALPLGSTSDIKKEIETALIADPDYVLGMKTHLGVREFIAEIYPTATLIIVTARPPDAMPLTRRWLQNHRISYDKLVNAQEEKKGLFATDVLVDDYPRNVAEYLTTTNGVAILVDQPWNRDHLSLQEWEGDGRVRYAKDLKEATRIIRELSTPENKGAATASLTPG